MTNRAWCPANLSQTLVTRFMTESRIWAKSMATLRRRFTLVALMVSKFVAEDLEIFDKLPKLAPMALCDFLERHQPPRGEI